jgi:hypothetical protein
MDGVDQYVGVYRYQSSIDFNSSFWCDSSRRTLGYFSSPGVPGIRSGIGKMRNPFAVAIVQWLARRV